MTSREQYDRLIETYIKAHEEGNENAIGRLFTENALLLGSGFLPVRGRQAIQKAYKDEHMGDGVKLVMTVEEFQDSGELLYGVGTFEAVGETGNFLDILQRQRDNSFLYHIIIWNLH